MIAVINFGSQFAHLIARRVRDLGVYSEILPYDVNISKIKEMKEREEAELASWEKELESVKIKIESIEKGIFSKI